MFSISLLSLIINITSYIKHSSFPEHFLRIIKVFAKVYPLLTLFLYDMFAKGMVENIKKVSERATMTEIQKICMLGSARILRKVLSV